MLTRLGRAAALTATAGTFALAALLAPADLLAEPTLPNLPAVVVPGVLNEDEPLFHCQLDGNLSCGPTVVVTTPRPGVSCVTYPASPTLPSTVCADADGRRWSRP